MLVSDFDVPAPNPLSFCFTLAQETAAFWISNFWFMMVKSFFCFGWFGSCLLRSRHNGCWTSKSRRTLVGPRYSGSLVTLMEQSSDFLDFVRLALQCALDIHFDQAIRYAGLTILFDQGLSSPGWSFYFLKLVSLAPIVSTVDMKEFCLTLFLIWFTFEPFSYRRLLCWSFRRWHLLWSSLLSAKYSILKSPNLLLHVLVCRLEHHLFGSFRFHPQHESVALQLEVHFEPSSRHHWRALSMLCLYAGFWSCPRSDRLYRDQLRQTASTGGGIRYLCAAWQSC